MDHSIAKSSARRIVAAGAVAWMCAAPAGAQSAGSGTPAASLQGTENIKAFLASRIQKGWTQPKTPWGHPDIQGVFTTKDEANTPFERPEEWAGRRMDDITSQEFAAAVSKRQQTAVEQAPFAGGGEPDAGVAIAVPIHWFDNLQAKNSRPWFVIDPTEGKIPAVTPEAKKRGAGNLFAGFANARGLDAETVRRGGKRDTYLDRYLGDRCIMWGVGVPHFPTIYGNSLQIVQAQDRVMIRYEMVHEARTVHLDGRPAPNASIYGYMGYSRGYWDGGTLVVETTNLHPKANYFGAPGATLRIVERFTRISPTQVEWTMTFDDPTTWERPWTYSLPMTEDNTQLIHEYACHEGNFGMANLLTAARAAEPGATPAGSGR